jgi:hypothetical protein
MDRKGWAPLPSPQEHTPGPWTYSVERGEIVLANGHSVVASFRDGTEPCEADARLIAHAPAMLAFIRKVAVRLCEHRTVCPSNDRCNPCEARAILRAVEGA